MVWIAGKLWFLSWVGWCLKGRWLVVSVVMTLVWTLSEKTMTLTRYWWNRRTWRNHWPIQILPHLDLIFWRFRVSANITNTCWLIGIAVIITAMVMIMITMNQTVLMKSMRWANRCSTRPTNRKNLQKRILFILTIVNFHDKFYRGWAIIVIVVVMWQSLTGVL